MSDDFDEEAEREKLREQFGREEEDRERTARMSELLLKGATMTNKHCSTCHSPIFRHEGEEFCPTCREPVGGGADAPADAPADDGSTDMPGQPEHHRPEHHRPEHRRTDTAPAASTDEEPAPDTNGDRTADAVEPANERTAGDATPDASADDRQPAADPRPETSRSAGPSRTPDGDAGSPATGTESGSRGGAEPGDAAHASPAAGPGGTDLPVRRGDLSAARASLERTVTRYARAAEETDDVDRVREFVAVTRETAEALAAVKRAEQ